MKYLNIQIILLVMVYKESTAQTQCPPGWIRFHEIGACYLVVSDRTANAYEAERACTRHPYPNTHLASCLSEDEGNFLQNYLVKYFRTTNDRYWFVGIHQRNAQGKFRFLNGSTIKEYLPWYKVTGWLMIYEPSNQQCAAFGRNTITTYWKNIEIKNYNCYDQAHYICKINTCGPKCLNGWIQYGDDCFLVVDNDKKTENDAEHACRKLGANTHLASCFSSSKEAYFLQHYLAVTYRGNTAVKFHVGLNQHNSDGLTRYADGRGIGVPLPWATNYRQNSRYQCVVFGKSRSLINYPCLSMAHYICKRGPTSCGPKYVCPTGWLQHDNKCYLVFYKAKTNYMAQVICNNRASYVLEINSAPEQFFVNSTMFVAWYKYRPINRFYWLSMTNTETWSRTKSPMVYKNFCPTQGYPGQTGEGVILPKVFCWAICSPKCDPEIKTASFICEKDAATA